MGAKLITISRQYCSGGHEIAVKLAESLGIPYYDNEIISKASEASGIHLTEFMNAENVPANNFLYSMSMLGPSTEIYGMPFSEKIFTVQSETIRAMAEKGSAVFIGRCSDYVLKDFDGCVNIFFSGSLRKRAKRAMDLYGFAVEEAQKKVKNADRSRSTYYNYHTGAKWGDPDNYDLVINTDKVTAEGAVEVIKAYLAGMK